jgi:plasmid maintenance system antidote protein VapI
MSKDKNPLPFRRPPGPGCHIVKELEARGIDRDEFCKKISRAAKLPYSVVESILEGPESFEMVAPLAFQLELELGISAENWMALQANYDLWPLRKAHEQKQKKEKLSV